MEKPRIKIRNKKLNRNLKDDTDLNNFENTNSKDNINQKENSANLKTTHDIICIFCHSKINIFNDCIPCYGYLCNSFKNINKNQFEIIHPQKNSSFNPSTLIA